MPELPDVEIFRQYFDSASLNKSIKDVKVLDKKILSGISPKDFEQKLKGEKFKSTYRHGKYLIAELKKNKLLIMHFGMTGFLTYFKREEDASKHIRILFDFSNGYHLGYDCQRKFGRVTLVENANEFFKKKKVGIDPLKENISFNDFKKLIGSKKGNIKSVLMDQSVISGIGNIYSDEILFQSDIHPSTEINKLKEEELKKVFNAIKKILTKAIEKEADPEQLPESWLILHRKKEVDCPKCSGMIKHKTIGGRSSYFCNKHQKKK